MAGMTTSLNSSVTKTPARQRPLSLELQQVIEEKNLLSTEVRSKVISALSEINGHEALHSSLRSRATQEILSSELSYVKQLEVVMKFFMEPIKEGEMMSPEDFGAVFGQIETVYRVAGALVSELQSCKDANLAPAFVRLAPFLKMYSVYACGYQKASRTLQNLRRGKQGSALHAFLQGQESRPEVSCSLQALLITPVQRLPRYRLLLKEVSAHTAPDDPNLHTLTDALKGVEASALHVDAVLSEQEQLERLFELQQSLLDEWPQLIRPGRSFVKEGSFMKVARCGTKAVQVHLVLLSDMFLCCRVRSGQLDCRYAFPLDRSSLENVLGQAVFKVLCGTETLLLFAKNQHEGELWTRLMQKTIAEVKASRQTLRKQTRKRLPKRLEELEENTTPPANLFGRTLRKRKQQSPSSSSTSLNSKKFRSSARYLSRLSPSPPKDSLYPLRKQEALKAHKSMTSSPSFFSSKKKPLLDRPKVEASKEAAAEDKSHGEKEAVVEKSDQWAKHCVQLVRNVATFIRSTFKL